MNPRLRGIFITSEDPARTARFYREVAKLELEQIGDAATYVYWRVDRDGMQFAIHDARQFSNYTHPARIESNLTHLYFQIEDQSLFLKHLSTLGHEPYATDDVVVTVEDPDGRKVMFGTA
jgi:hypothetical protein